MSEPLDLRTKQDRWIVTRHINDRAYDIPSTPYEAWLRQRMVSPEGRSYPDQASFFAGWNALQDWLMFGLGFEGRLSDYERTAAAAKHDGGRESTGHDSP